jgi:hypothetical protein
MGRYMLGLAALGLLAVLSTPAQAQFTGYGAGGQFLLLNKSVQEELKLSKEQLEKLKDKVEDVLGGFKDKLAKIREMEPEDRAKLMDSITDKTNKIVVDVLDKDQVKRLREIDLQQRGPMALYDPEVRKALDITEKQLKELKELAAETNKALHKAHDDKDQKAIDAAIESGLKKLGDLLTDEQKKKWKEMLGKSFTVKIEKKE